MQKVRFDAKAEPSLKNEDLYANTWKYSFIHNFKVHYKVSVLQALANKIDISIPSSSPGLPPVQRVLDEFNQRMQLGNVSRNDKGRKSAISYHVTDIEYKESIALQEANSLPEVAPLPRPPMLIRAMPAGQLEGPLYCNQCGSKLPDDSKYCNRCGSAVVIG